MRFETTLNTRSFTLSALHQILSARSYPARIMAENGTHERGNGHAYAIFAESAELGKIKRK
jgi:hypothetical protein